MTRGIVDQEIVNVAVVCEGLKMEPVFVLAVGDWSIDRGVAQQLWERVNRSFFCW